MPERRITVERGTKLIGNRLQYGFVCGTSHGRIGHPDLEQLSVPACFRPRGADVHANGDEHARSTLSMRPCSAAQPLLSITQCYRHRRFASFRVFFKNWIGAGAACAQFLKLKSDPRPVKRIEERKACDDYPISQPATS